MRITTALIDAAKRAELERRERPVITMPRDMLADIAGAIETDLGTSRLYPNPYDGFKFAGIEFKHD